MGKHANTKDTNKTRTKVVKKNVKKDKRYEPIMDDTKKKKYVSNAPEHFDVANKKNIKAEKKAIKKAKKKKRRRIVLLILLVLVLALGIFVGVRLYRAGGNWLMALLGHDQNTRQNLDKLQFLILGESTGNSDTIIIAQYDPKDQTAALFSIPRDTFVGDDLDDATWTDKINSKYGQGKTIEKTVDAVNKITGLNIHYYILVDTAALNKLVDIIGGLDFNVPIDMDYDDPTQDLTIHFKAGYQHLSGKQVEQLVRFRKNNNRLGGYTGVDHDDFGRMKTQRDVIIALGKQTLKVKNITEIGSIIDTLKTYVDTNMDLNAIKDYIPYAVELDASTIKTSRVPGSDGYGNGIYFFIPDLDETKVIIDELFNGIVPKTEEETNDNSTVNNSTSTN